MADELEATVTVDTPPPAPPAEEAAPPSRGEDVAVSAQEIGELLDLGEEGEGEAPPPPKPEKPAEPVAAAPAVAPAVAAPAPPASPQPTPTPTPVPPAEAVPPAQPVQPAAEPTVQPAAVPTQEQYLQQLKQRRDATKELIQSQYKLTDEDAAALAVEPNKVLPRLVADLYMDVYDAVFGTVVSQLPQLVNGINQARSHEQTLEQRFYEKWPALKKPEYAEAVARLGTAYRRSNPNVTLEKAIQDIGAMAHVSLGVPYEVAQSGQPTVQPPAAAPAPRPFTPAVGGAPPASAAPAADPWVAMAEEFKNLD